MIGLEILIKISPGKRYEFLQTFVLVAQSKAKMQPEVSHRASQTLFEKTDEPNCFLWMEEWSSADKLASYMPRA